MKRAAEHIELLMAAFFWRQQPRAAEERARLRAAIDALAGELPEPWRRLRDTAEAALQAPAGGLAAAFEEVGQALAAACMVRAAPWAPARFGLRTPLGICPWCGHVQSDAEAPICDDCGQEIRPITGAAA